MSSPSQRVEPMTLLRTKLHTPRVRDDLIPYPRLVERLSRDLDSASRAALVGALAGFSWAILLVPWLNAGEAGCLTIGV